MPEVVIKYKKPKTLKMIKALAEYLDFEISAVKEKETKVNGVTIIPADKIKRKSSLDDILIPGDKTLNISDLSNVFTGSGIDAKKLREEAWKRAK